MGVGDDVARHGRISDAKLAEIEQTLAEFQRTCNQEGIARVAAVGTAAFREAANGARVVAIAAAHGIPMEIATEQRESELAYLVASLGQDGYAVIDNGSQSVELVSTEDRALRFVVFDLGYRRAWEEFFAQAPEPGPAVLALQNRLTLQASKAGFMRGRQKLVGVEFGEMADVLFERAALEGRTLTLAQLKERLHQITTSPAHEFQQLKTREQIDRALPRLVVAATLTEAFGYSELELTERELGTGLIIEAGLAGSSLPAR